MTGEPADVGVTRWTDSHCHIQSMDGTAGILARAGESGVAGRWSSATTRLVAASRRARRLVAPGDPVELWATVGLHPHEAQARARAGPCVDRGAGVPPGRPVGRRVVAVGECGLDFHYDHSPGPGQREAFAAQMQLAQRYGLALVVHTQGGLGRDLRHPRDRGRARALRASIASRAGRRRLTVPSLGAVLSFSGIVTFTSAGELRRRPPSARSTGCWSRRTRPT